MTGHGDRTDSVASASSLYLHLKTVGSSFTSLNPDSDLRRQYYQRLSPILSGDEFEIAIQRTEGFSFGQLRETHILGAQSAFEHGSEVGVADVVEAIELQSAGAQDLKTSVPASGFVRDTEPSARRK